MAPVARGVKRIPGFFFVERKISRTFFAPLSCCSYRWLQAGVLLLALPYSM